jgi:cadmium resistance protein CadD (predicted permease)
MLFFSGGKYKASHIVMGQYLGIATLLVISLIGSFIGSFFDQRYVGLLGFFPMYLAIKQVVELTKRQKAVDEKGELLKPGFGVLSIAGVTIANGGDNLGVYIPLLSPMTAWDKVLLTIVFAVMVYVWCAMAKYLAYHPLLAKSLEKYGHLIMPFVLFALGVFILYESRTFSLFF